MKQAKTRKTTYSIIFSNHVVNEKTNIRESMAVTSLSISKKEYVRMYIFYVTSSYKHAETDIRKENGVIVRYHKFLSPDYNDVITLQEEHKY